MFNLKTMLFEFYRCVTNFVSAHDANCSLTIDIYHNEKNEEIDFDPNNPSGGKDSIWNFHVSSSFSFMRLN